MSHMLSRNYIVFTLVVNGLIPWGMYMLLSPYVGHLMALSIVTLIPLVENVFHFAKHRNLDVFGGLMLMTFILSLVMVLLGGSEKMLLLRESMITGVVGIVFLSSLLLNKPMIYHLASRFTRVTNIEQKWQNAYFRKMMRNMTLIWGVLLVLEACTKVVMIYELSVGEVLALSSVVLYSFVGVAIGLTVVYRRRAVGKMNQQQLSSF
ncbi:VC0807 family protein [Paenibacillus nicotianae]|uniref:VC0807 family protein n=1 Tax=Paenibacillus nicotianae TaxID=1526551 RepID=A0ABW4UZV6_9BACL